MASFTDRMIRAAKLDAALYEEVEADKGAMGQAMGVVILSSVAAGIGTISAAGINGLIFGTIVALLGWFIWAFLTYFIGTRLLPEPQTKADMGNCCAPSDSPVLREFCVFWPLSPCWGPFLILSLVSGCWWRWSLPSDRRLIIKYLASSWCLFHRLDRSDRHFRFVFLVGGGIRSLTGVNRLLSNVSAILRLSKT